LALMVINLPRILTTAWDSFFLQWHNLGHEAALHAIVTVIQMLVLMLPVAGILYTLLMVARKWLSGGWHATAGRPVARAAFVTVTGALFAGVGWIWSPSAVYRPIQRGERGTVVGGID